MSPNMLVGSGADLSIAIISMFYFFFLFFLLPADQNVVEVAALLWSEYTANKETDDIIKGKLIVILFSPFPQKPFSNRTTQIRNFFSELSTFIQFFIPFLLFSSSTRVELSKTKPNQKQNKNFSNSYSVVPKWTFYWIVNLNLIISFPPILGT